jgi:C4-dicarboxylate-specific signal transduction histidine kinase
LRLVATVFANALSRKRAVQEQLQLSRALEHAGRVATIGQLASSFAHEIKQPLGASLTNAQTALRLLNSPRPDLAETRAALEDIVDDIRRTGDIVSELRRFLRRQEPSLEVMRVDELVQAVVRFVSPEARSHAVAVRIDRNRGFGPDLARDCRCRARLQRGRDHRGVAIPRLRLQVRQEHRKLAFQRAWRRCGVSLVS